jgi:CBS domain-containing protein
MGQLQKVRDAMRRDFAQVGPEESLADARETMRMGRLRHLLVTRDDVLLGLISYRDLVELLSHPDVQRLAGSAVGDFMRKLPTTIRPESPLAAAADPMCRYGLGCLPVVEPDGRLIGLLTETDLLRAAFGVRRAS